MIIICISNKVNKKKLSVASAKKRPLSAKVEKVTVKKSKKVSVKEVVQESASAISKPKATKRGAQSTVKKDSPKKGPIGSQVSKTTAKTGEGKLTARNKRVASTKSTQKEPSTVVEVVKPDTSSKNSKKKGLENIEIFDNNFFEFTIIVNSLFP